MFTPCEHGAVKDQGLIQIGTRWVFTNKGDTEHMRVTISPEPLVPHPVVDQVLRSRG